jgi:hypothetical protein
MIAKSKAWIWLVALTAVGMTGCATQVKRVGVEEVKDLSGAWNDTDSRLVSEEMIRDSLNGGWISRHQANHRPGNRLANLLLEEPSEYWQ